MNARPPFPFAHSTLLCCVLLSTACSTFPVAPSRPPPFPTPPTPPVGAPAPLPAPAPPPSTQPARPVTPPVTGVIAPPRPQNDATNASTVLVQQSRAQRAAGSLPAAKASLERALRLDPNSPEIWVELGEIELQTGNAAQAATMARKALSLAGRSYALTNRAERLLRAAE